MDSNSAADTVTVAPVDHASTSQSQIEQSCSVPACAPEALSPEINTAPEQTDPPLGAESRINTALEQTDPPLGAESSMENSAHILNASAQSLPEISTTLEQTDPPLGGESSMEHNAHTLNASAQSRLEALIEQQNLLMLRQLQLAEDSCKPSETLMCTYEKPRKFLKALDPCVRVLFADWQKEFCGKIGLYVAQSELSKKYQMALAKGELIRPFLDEAKKPWEWTAFYRSVAKPISGPDPILADGIPVGLADVNGKPRDTPHSSEHSNVYDIDSAFAELRRRHAVELQNFVVAHQKVCLEQIVEELALPNQVRILQEKLAAWTIDNSGLCNPHCKQHLESKAKQFVELVYRDEMPKAENKIKEDKMPSSSFITMMRIVSMVAVLLAVTTMSHELLTRLFASLFALGCGMALLWEDLVVCSVRVLLGETVRRLRLLGAVQDRVRNQIPAMINVPAIVW